MAKSKNIIIIILLLLTITSILYFFEYYDSPLSRLFRYFYFIPILLSSYYFGLSFGVVTSICASFLYIPSIAISFQVGKINSELIFTLILFNLIAIIIGCFSDNATKRNTNSQFIYEITKIINEAGFDKYKLINELSNFLIRNFNIPSLIIKLDELLINKNFDDNLVTTLTNCGSEIYLPPSNKLNMNVLSTPLLLNNNQVGIIAIGYIERNYDYKNLLSITSQQLIQAIAKINLFEEKLKLKSYQRKILNNLTVGVLVLNRKDKISIINNEARSLLRKDKKLLKDIKRLYPNKIITRQINNIPVSINSIPLPNKETMIILENLTDKKKLEELEELNEMKSKLINMNYYQLRGALDRISELTNILIEEKVNNINELQNEITKNINTILDFTERLNIE